MHQPEMRVGEGVYLNLRLESAHNSRDGVAWVV